MLWHYTVHAQETQNIGSDQPKRPGKPGRRRQSVAREKAEEVGRAAEEAEEQGEREIQLDWASVVEVESDRNK